MDRPGVCQVPEGSGEQGKMEETGSELFYGGPTTYVVKGQLFLLFFLVEARGFRKTTSQRKRQPHVHFKCGPKSFFNVTGVSSDSCGKQQLSICIVLK